MKGNVKKIAVVAVIAALVVVFWVFDLGQYLTLSYIKDSQVKFQSLYADKPVSVIATYMAIYILVTSLSLPGAAVMTLAGGALFGFVAGTIIVSFASTIGATLACFVSRFLLGNWVQNRFSERVRKVNEGVQKEGAFYLFTMRLIPAIPFWLINLAMGLTRMRLVTFYWVSQVGMLAGTMVYVNAGKELGELDSLSGILSPGLIASFVLLGVFPIITKKLMAFYKSRKGKDELKQ